MEMQNITIRLHPTHNQFDQLVDLQNENLLNALSKSEQSHGFLSVKFSVEQFKEMDENLCVAVALKEDKVVGYLATSTFEFNKQFEILSCMIQQYENLVLKGTPLFSQKLFIPGPICIHKNYRGKGIFVSLYKTLFDYLSRDFDIAVNFVSQINKRSLEAHQKIGMNPIDLFEFKGASFVILAKKL
jgi:hypothetical protein